MQDDEGHDLLPFFISEATTLTLSATVVSRNIGGKPCENEGTISDEPVVIVPGTVMSNVEANLISPFNDLNNYIIDVGTLAMGSGKTKLSPPPT